MNFMTRFVQLFIDSFRNPFFQYGFIYLAWIILHFFVANWYPLYCAEFTWTGFLKTPFIAETPHCVAMRWVIHNAGLHIHGMWIVVAMWIMQRIFTPVQ
jgi:hypothetical protein